MRVEEDIEHLLLVCPTWEKARGCFEVREEDVQQEMAAIVALTPGKSTVEWTRAKLVAMMVGSMLHLGTLGVKVKWPRPDDEDGQESAARVQRPKRQ